MGHYLTSTEFICRLGKLSSLDTSSESHSNIRFHFLICAAVPITFSGGDSLELPGLCNCFVIFLR